MKKLREKMDRYFDRLDDRWRSLPVGKQHLYTLYFFVGYLLLTVGVVAKVWYDTKQSKNDMHIEHIEKPRPQKERKPCKIAGHIINNFKK